MWNDPIVEETRKLRDAYAAQFDYDVESMAQDLELWAKNGYPKMPQSITPTDPNVS